MMYIMLVVVVQILIWFLSYAANAYTTGMKEELDLDSSAYNWAITMFFIGYVM